MKGMLVAAVLIASAAAADEKPARMLDCVALATAMDTVAKKDGVKDTSFNRFYGETVRGAEQAFVGYYNNVALREGEKAAERKALADKQEAKLKFDSSFGLGPNASMDEYEKAGESFGKEFLSTCEPWLPNWRPSIEDLPGE